jgi:hypothetical protein
MILLLIVARTFYRRFYWFLIDVHCFPFLSFLFVIGILLGIMDAAFLP